MNSYQKQKKRIAELENKVQQLHQDIYTMMNFSGKTTAAESATVMKKYLHVYSLDKLIWSGDAIPIHIDAKQISSGNAILNSPGTFDGFFNKSKKEKK